jgi:hypothetical protein
VTLDMTDRRRRARSIDVRVFALRDQCELEQLVFGVGEQGAAAAGPLCVPPLSSGVVHEPTRRR